VLHDSIGYLECQPVSHLDSGDHRIFLAEVIDGHYASDQGPMVHIRKSGMHY
jgi:flavin reductase (DIM6/NTAB) family NADH-FMN oxidoreductase RutF